MKIKLLFICIYVNTVVCEENSIFYCVTDSDYGLTVTDNVYKKDTSFYASTKYSENVTSLNISVTGEWKAYSPMDRRVFKGPVIDERWESFQTNKDNAKDFESLLSNSSTHPLFFSVRIYKNTLNLSKHLPSDQWYHLKVENNKVFLCNSSKCDGQLNITDPKEFFMSTSSYGRIWKLHYYIYYQTNTKNTTTIIYNSTSMDCTQVQRGWIKLHVAMCAHCTMSFNLQPNDYTNRNETFQQKGTGQWETITHIFENFTSCFNLSLTTMDINEDEGFWAIGDRLYFSNNHSCNNITRYIEFNTIYTYDMSDFTCELSNNTKYNFTSELPKTKCVEPTHQDIPKGPLEKSSFASIYLLILIPLAGGIVLVLYVLRRRIKIICKQNTKSEEDLQLLQNRELPNKAISWPPIKISEFDEYIRHILNTEERIRRQFSDLPSGFLEPAQEAKKEENFQKNRFSNIIPYDVNRVKLRKNSFKKHFNGDYINASYIQGPNSYKEYIIAQSPQANTVTDFWMMIWQKRISYCVKISTDREEYIRYWPTISEKFVTYADITISLIKTDSHNFYRKHELLLKKKNESRKIYLLHYYSWSEDDLNLAKTRILPFIHELERIPHYTAPVLFHCLDGAGQSGTVVLCDMVLRLIPITGVIDIFQIMTTLRKSRANAVNNLQQYMLAHLIIRDFLNER